MSHGQLHMGVEWAWQAGAYEPAQRTSIPIRRCHSLPPAQRRLHQRMPSVHPVYAKTPIDARDMCRKGSVRAGRGAYLCQCFAPLRVSSQRQVGSELDSPHLGIAQSRLVGRLEAVPDCCAVLPSDRYCQLGPRRVWCGCNRLLHDPDGLRPRAYPKLRVHRLAVHVAVLEDVHAQYLSGRGLR